MLKDKIFIDKNLNIRDLSVELNTNRTTLSRIINTKFNTNFNNFINEYRIKEACKLYEANIHKTLTNKAIANKIGFNSESTFYTAFKKFCGVTPSVYIKNIGFTIK